MYVSPYNFPFPDIIKSARRHSHELWFANSLPNCENWKLLPQTVASVCSWRLWWGRPNRSVLCTGVPITHKNTFFEDLEDSPGQLSFSLSKARHIKSAWMHFWDWPSQQTIYKLLKGKECLSTVVSSTLARCWAQIWSSICWMNNHRDNKSLILLLLSLVFSHYLQPHGLWHARLLCLPLSPGVCSNSCPVLILVCLCLLFFFFLQLQEQIQVLLFSCYLISLPLFYSPSCSLDFFSPLFLCLGFV